MEGAEQLAALRDDLVNATDRFDRILAELPGVAEAGLAHWYVPAALAAEVRWAVRTAVASGRRVSELVWELLVGAGAPGELLRLGWRWRDVKGGTSAVAADVGRPDAPVAGSEWTGPARSAYAATVAAQAGAAGQLGAIADGTAGALTECVVAGTAFYAALAVIVARLLAAAVAALAAFGTAVFSWAGAALIVEEAGVGAAAIGTALTALGLCLAAQARTMTSLHGLAVDRTAFPDGAWPGPNVVAYADASVTDGDADWSLRR